MKQIMDTPPQSLSRASTVALDSHEREALKTPPTYDSSRSSDVEVIDVETRANPVPKADPATFEPHKILMETTITIEYGSDLKNTLTIHEELLRCHSKEFEQLVARAKSLREQYAKTKVMRDHIGCCVFPEVTAKEFEEKCLEKRAVSLVVNVYDRFPLLERQPAIKGIIDTALEEQLSRKNTKAPSSGTSRKRDYREMSSDMGIRERLLLLNSPAMHAVTGHLFAKMHKIHKAEAFKAKTERVKAVAQGRILMPEFTDATVRAFVQWLYHSTVQYQEAKELYALWDFSNQLGTEALSEICLTELYNAACNGIRHALAQGISISSLLLDNRPEITDNVVDVVFIHVLKDKQPPGRLLRLVIDTLADNVDANLWAHVKTMISHDKALQLIEAMIMRQQIQIPNVNPENVKSENDADLEDQPGFNGNQQDPIHVG